MEQVSDRYRATLSGFYSVTWSIGFSVVSTVPKVMDNRVLAALVQSGLLAFLLSSGKLSPQELSSK
jgi:hypothetical protein